MTQQILFRCSSTELPSLSVGSVVAVSEGDPLWKSALRLGFTESDEAWTVRSGGSESAHQLCDEAHAELISGALFATTRLRPTMAEIAVASDRVVLCCSVRITADAHEAGVETHPDFRGRGHAGSATAAWGRLVRETRAVPLYSTSAENPASRRVAAKLGLERFGTDFHLS